MSDEQWYWSLKQHRVVRGDEEKAAHRLGPYATREEAARAVDEVAQRNEAWDNDPRFNDEDETEQAEEEQGDEPSEGWGPFKH
ncbi:hypothetical protein [Luteococcus peritonei]|uniref:SPOR domain-containing protein n=1 Tax=Luteococcus peritonei TaxID=88874 RepID=A0ABW4RWT9_9ACTN